MNNNYISIISCRAVILPIVHSPPIAHVRWMLFIFFINYRYQDLDFLFHLNFININNSSESDLKYFEYKYLEIFVISHKSYDFRHEYTKILSWECILYFSISIYSSKVRNTVIIRNTLCFLKTLRIFEITNTHKHLYKNVNIILVYRIPVLYLYYLLFQRK